MKPSLSIIICSYNRIELLSLVLKETIQAIQNFPFELLIIDNNSKDATSVEVNKIAEQNKQVKYFLEKNQGLSYARNRGVREALSEWVMFLDDDGLPASNLFPLINAYLDQQEQLIVGGHYSAWYYYGKEKWSKDAYYSNYPTIKSKTFLEGDKYLSGGLLLMHKSLFDLVGYFNVDLGMIGNKIGYSEETEFQMRLKDHNIKLLYDPTLSMRHVVAVQKLNVKWFFKAKKALAEALFQTRFKNKFQHIIVLPFLAIAQALFLSIKNLFKLLGSDYFIENYIIDSFSKPYKWIVIWKQFFSKAS